MMKESHIYAALYKVSFLGLYEITFEISIFREQVGTYVWTSMNKYENPLKKLTSLDYWLAYSDEYFYSL